MKKKQKDYIIVPTQALSREEIAIEYMVADLKKAFKEKWAQTHRGNPYRKIDRADSREYWVNAAKIVLEMHGTADMFVEAQFTRCKMTVTPAHLATPNARKRFRAYLNSKGMNDPVISKTLIDTDGTIDPGKAEVRDILDAHVDCMKNTYGVQDLSSTTHREIVLTSPWMFNPLAACIFFYNDDEVMKLFKKNAKDRLLLDPYLQRAMHELQYDEQLTAIMTE